MGILKYIHDYIHILLEQKEIYREEILSSSILLIMYTACLYKILLISQIMSELFSFVA